MYSDVNKGPPVKTCADALNNFITGKHLSLTSTVNFYNYGVGFIIMAIWFFICFFVQFGLCCRKENPNLSKYAKAPEEKPKKIRKKAKTERVQSSGSDIEYKKEKVVY